MNIVITAKTSSGDKALKQHWEEAKKMSFREKLTMKALGIKHELTNEDPFTITLSCKATNIYIIEGAKEEIRKALKANGAEKETDYSMR